MSRRYCYCEAEQMVVSGTGPCRRCGGSLERKLATLATLEDALPVEFPGDVRIGGLLKLSTNGLASHIDDGGWIA